MVSPGKCNELLSPCQAWSFFWSCCGCGFVPAEDLAERLAPYLSAAGFQVEQRKLLAVTPLIRERIKTLSDAARVADFFFVDELHPYDAGELIPQKGDAAMALALLQRARQVLAVTEFRRESLEEALRAEAAGMGVKSGPMFQPIRVAVCGRKAAPPLFETLEVLGPQTCLKRIDQAIEKLQRELAGQPAGDR